MLLAPSTKSEKLVSAMIKPMTCKSALALVRSGIATDSQTWLSEIGHSHATSLSSHTHYDAWSQLKSQRAQCRKALQAAFHVSVFCVDTSPCFVLVILLGAAVNCLLGQQAWAALGTEALALLSSFLFPALRSGCSCCTLVGGPLLAASMAAMMAYPEQAHTLFVPLFLLLACSSDTE